MNNSHLETALGITFENEGVYSDNFGDPGGETIYGISRRWHPELAIWKLVDSWDKKGTPAQSVLKEAAKFYRNTMWFPLNMDSVATRSPQLSYAVFDTTVHLWVDQSIVFLQHTINCLSKASGVKLRLDGVIGTKTLAALHSSTADDKLLVNTYGIIRGNWYLTENRWDGKHLGYINRIAFIS